MFISLVITLLFFLSINRSKIPVAQVKKRIPTYIFLSDMRHRELIIFTGKRYNDYWKHTTVFFKALKKTFDRLNVYLVVVCLSGRSHAYPYRRGTVLFNVLAVIIHTAERPERAYLLAMNILPC